MFWIEVGNQTVVMEVSIIPEFYRWILRIMWWNSRPMLILAIEDVSSTIPVVITLLHPSFLSRFSRIDQQAKCRQISKLSAPDLENKQQDQTKILWQYISHYELSFWSNFNRYLEGDETGKFWLFFWVTLLFGVAY